MANDYFQFKQFRVVQRDLGMKVTTDACVFGALLADTLPDVSSTVLDIGAGTGLLSLMAAQLHHQVQITAIEIDESASRQARENCDNSPWADRLTVLHQSVQDFQESTREKYDLIVANPPFYASHQQSNDSRRAKAHHSSTLSQADLVKAVDQLLSPDGQFTVLLPAFEAKQLQQLLEEQSSYLRKSVRIYNRMGDNRIFRVVNTYGREEGAIQDDRFDIRTTDNVYSPDFVRYLSPFYLHL